MITIVSIPFTEVGRSKLCVVLGMLNWLCVAASVVLIGAGIYILKAVREYAILIKDYDANTLPYSLIGLGLVSLVFAWLVGALYFFSHDPKNRSTLVSMFYLYLILDFLLCVCVLTAGILCYLSIGHLDRALHGGLQSAMLRYRYEEHTKLEIDLLQVNFQCCGSNNYSDWFQVDWIEERYQSEFSYGMAMKVSSEIVYLHDNAPFSCCDAHAQRPCINTDVWDDKVHSSYNPSENITLYEVGCVEALMDFLGDTLLVNVGAAVFTVAGLKAVILLLTRILQTSILTALRQDDPLGPSYGYLIEFGVRSTDNSGNKAGMPVPHTSYDAVNDGYADDGYAYMNESEMDGN